MDNSGVLTATAWDIIHETAQEATALVIQEVVAAVVAVVVVVAVTTVEEEDAVEV